MCGPMIQGVQQTTRSVGMCPMSFLAAEFESEGTPTDSCGWVM